MHKKIVSDSELGGYYARKGKRLILQGVAITVSALAIWFNESFIEKGPREEYVLLRQQICRRLYYGSEAHCCEQL